MAYKETLNWHDKLKQTDSSSVEYMDDKQDVIDGIQTASERFGMTSHSSFNLDGTIDIHLEGVRFICKGKAVPMKHSLSRLELLKEKDVFKFIGENQKFRKVQQLGKTELYAPYQGQNTMGHSMSSAEEVYGRSFTAVILYTEK